MSRKTPQQLWNALQDDAARDDLDDVMAMSKAQLDTDIRAHGGDPDAIGARGAKRVQENLDRQMRLEWTEAVRKQMEAHRAKADEIRARPKRTRDALLEDIARARQDARFAQPIAAMFREKALEASTDDELATLAMQIEILADDSA